MSTLSEISPLLHSVNFNNYRLNLISFVGWLVDWLICFASCCFVCWICIVLFCFLCCGLVRFALLLLCFVLFCVFVCLVDCLFVVFLFLFFFNRLKVINVAFCVLLLFVACFVPLQHAARFSRTAALRKPVGWALNTINYLTLTDRSASRIQRVATMT